MESLQLITLKGIWGVSNNISLQDFKSKVITSITLTIKTNKHRCNISPLITSSNTKIHKH